MSTSSNEKKYDSTINKIFLRPFFKKVLDLLPKEAGQFSLLEVGCGEGYVLERIRTRFPQARLGALDISGAAVTKAKQRVSGADIMVGSALELPYPDNSFDQVLCLEVLEHVPDPDRALSELIRVSKQQVILSVPHEPWFSWGSFLRGKYWAQLGRHPEHVHFWNKKSLAKFLRTQSKSLSIQNAFPWLIASIDK
jgi:ubiquinone/menaquinone biosynthesis C-methylase UbiE